MVKRHASLIPEASFKRSPIIIMAMALSLASAHAAASETAALAPRDIVITPHTFENEAGETLIGEKGYVLVPEVRGDPNSRLIKVAFIRIPSATKTPAPPVFYLHGGPNAEGVIASQSSRLDRLSQMRIRAAPVLPCRSQCVHL